MTTDGERAPFGSSSSMTSIWSGKASGRSWR